jgi:hypothetical protein
MEKKKKDNNPFNHPGFTGVDYSFISLFPCLLTSSSNVTGLVPIFVIQTCNENLQPLKIA